VIGVDELYSFRRDFIHFSHPSLLNLSLASEEAFDFQRMEKRVQSSMSKFDIKKPFCFLNDLVTPHGF